jgi:hypothetical protein
MAHMNSSHIPDHSESLLFGFSLKSSSFAYSLAMLSGALLMNGPFVAITKRTRLSFILSFRFFDVFGVLEAHEIFDPWEKKTKKEHGTKQNKKNANCAH